MRDFLFAFAVGTAAAAAFVVGVGALMLPVVLAREANTALPLLLYMPLFGLLVAFSGQGPRSRS